MKCPAADEDGLPQYIRTGLDLEGMEGSSVYPGLHWRNLRSLEFRDAKDGLHDGTEIAAIAQVLETRVPRAIHGLQLCPRLLDHFPLADSWLDVIVSEPVLCLGQSH